MNRLLAIVAGAAVLCLALWWQAETIKDLRADLDTERRSVATLEEARQANAQTISLLRGDIKVRDDAIIRRDRKVEALEREHAASMRAYKEEVQNDEATRAWDAVPVPAAVHRLFGKGGTGSRAGDGTGAAPGLADAGDDGSGVERRDQR
ncbi:hypothetical protein ACR4XJ_11000 [Nitratidesulfovibrio sp. D1]|uniref:hypothetical protein n=1 Tax=Nitratidesulfovibrio sp. D1 TaxID=3440151 RepID=UPI003EBE3F59